MSGTDDAAVETHEVTWLPSGSHLEVVLGDEPLPPALCTAAFALAQDAAGGILMARVHKRGLDIVGGHVEPGETPEETVVRETREETGAEIRLLEKIGHIRLVVSSPPPGYRYPTPVSYHPFYRAEILSMGAVEMPEECGEPEIVAASALLADPRFAIHRTFIAAAMAAFAPSPRR